MNDFLRIDEWRRWAEDDRAFKAEMRNHVRDQSTINGNIDARIDEVERVQRGAQKSAVTWSSGISAVVSAVVTSVLAAMKGHA